MTMPGKSRQFWRDETGVAAVEFAAIFPIMVSILLGCIDVGSAFWLNRKVVTATQSLADVLAREESLTDATINQAVTGARMMMQPFASNDVGYDIAGIQFTAGNPQIIWRRTENMTEASELPQATAGMGAVGEGVIAVVMTAPFRPSFYGFVMEEFDMREIAILRGRLASFIPLES